MARAATYRLSSFGPNQAQSLLTLSGDSVELFSLPTLEVRPKSPGDLSSQHYSSVSPALWCSLLLDFRWSAGFASIK